MARKRFLAEIDWVAPVLSKVEALAKGKICPIIHPQFAMQEVRFADIGLLIDAEDETMRTLKISTEMLEYLFNGIDFVVLENANTKKEANPVGSKVIIILKEYAGRDIHEIIAEKLVGLRRALFLPYTNEKTQKEFPVYIVS